MNLTGRITGKTGLIFASVLFVLRFMPAKAEEPKSGNEVVSYGVGVTLTGRVTTRLEYGAPGFGEDPKTDAKENIFLFVLKRPVDVHADKERPSDTDTDDFNGVKEMQLVFMKIDKKLFRKMVGRKVKVTGSLFQAENGHHHTDVLIEVDKLEILK